MKKIVLDLFTHSIWGDFILGAIFILIFATLGYFSREFALDLQANFFSGWGAF